MTCSCTTEDSSGAFLLALQDARRSEDHVDVGDTLLYHALGSFAKALDGVKMDVHHCVLLVDPIEGDVEVELSE